ncbi:MAG TPA: OmpA family protein [Chryseosolibacter sp.]|nr:OmpA family protein [Chryseosolibacter sp.]
MKYILLVFQVIVLTCGESFSQESEPVVLKGKIINEKTREPIDAELDIYFDSDFILNDVQLSHNGEFSEPLRRYGWYIINVKAPGFLVKMDTLWVTREGRKLVERNYALTPIELGTTVVLNNIYFHFGTTILKPDSYPSLDQVVSFFKENPDVTFEIAGHTDDEGAEDYNMMLSQGRAQSIVEYLIKQGIDPIRLIARGYGESKPLDPGITKAAKARNRRVEFTVVDLASKQ